MFAPAVKTEAKLRLAIAGPSGSGKTYTALAVATALADGGKVAVLDTEHGSASKYADLFAFDVLNESAPFHPDKVTAAINDAGRGGYAVLILDSMSHFWNGPGGMTDIVDDIARRMKSPNSFAAWKDGTPIQQKMIEAIVSAPLHIIATMRSKQDYILETDERGKQRPRKVGMAPIQRDGFEYEFDVFMDMDNDNTGMIAKTRCPALTNGVFRKPGADVANILRDWLHGAPPAQPASRPTPAKTQPTIGRVPSAREAQVPTDDTNDQAAVSESGPLPDDELTVSESDPRQFIAVAASLLETDTDTVKARLKVLGYTGVPGDAAKRIAAYRRLKADLGTNEQDDLFGDDNAADRAAALATAQDRS